MTGLTRRRFLAIAATGVASQFGVATANQPPSTLWRGIALGAEARIRIDGYNEAEAAQIVALVRQEIDRLEKLFSLYRPDSAIARLNRNGILAKPDPDFLALLSLAAVVHRASGGLFDPTVQPIWVAYATACSGGTIRGDEAKSTIAAVAEQSRAGVGFEHVAFGPDEIAYRRPGMAMTLNGVAQGYVTDRIADLLTAHGLRHVLVDMGEIRAVDGRRDGSGWPVHFAASSGIPASRRTVLLDNRALATSASLGTTFDAAERLGHILDPRTGIPLSEPRQVTVEATTATLADALSTALCLMPNGEAVATLRAFPDTRLHTIG